MGAQLGVAFFQIFRGCSKIGHVNHSSFMESAMQVREILRVKGGTLYTVTPQQSLAFAIDSMADLDVGSLVVMDGGRMVGMLTFREVLSALRKNGSAPGGLTVGDVMVKDPVTAYPAMEVNELRGLMIEKRSRYLPVVDGGTLMGVISFLDVAKAVLEEQSLENKMLKSYIKNWPGETPAA
jgi:CBS domain-containing protein